MNSPKEIVYYIRQGLAHRTFNFEKGFVDVFSQHTAEYPREAAGDDQIGPVARNREVFIQVRGTFAKHGESRELSERAVMELARAKVFSEDLDLLNMFHSSQSPRIGIADTYVCLKGEAGLEFQAGFSRIANDKPSLCFAILLVDGWKCTLETDDQAFITGLASALRYRP